MSLGEDRVRVKFNPTENVVVATFKQKTAELIDMCNDVHRNEADPEIRRLCAIAMQHYEEGCNSIVKALTTSAYLTQ